LSTKVCRFVVTILNSPLCETGIEKLEGAFLNIPDTGKFASVIQNAAQQDVTDSGAWGIVISGDKKLDPDANDEVTKSKNAGLSNLKIYERENWFRTVVEFSSFSEAQAALPRLRALPNHASAYLVNLTKWCPMRKDSGNGTLQCVAS